jgi:hypothetical protein
VLREHLLEYHPEKMIPRFREELRRGDNRFAHAVDSCRNFGRGTNERKIQKLLDEAGERRKKSSSS